MLLPKELIEWRHSLETPLWGEAMTDEPHFFFSLNIGSAFTQKFT